MISVNSKLVKNWLADLYPSQPKWVRKNAVEKLGQLDASTPEIVEKLTAVLQNDPDEEVRRMARKTLQAPVHQDAEMSQTECQRKSNNRNYKQINKAGEEMNELGTQGNIVAEQTVPENELQGMSAEDLLREQVRILRKIEKQLNQNISGDGRNQNVIIRDISMTFGSMVELIIEFGIASIPAGVVLFLIGILLWVILGVIGIISF